MAAAKPSHGKDSQSTDSGLEYGRRVVGKGQFRIRDRHVADHLIPLMRMRRVGAVKLDLLLRGIALPSGAGARPEPGVILRRYQYEDLYDLVNGREDLGAAEPGTDAAAVEVVRLKRKWVREQLLRLETLNLVKRTPRPGRRPDIVVLRDTGTGEPFDDPDGSPGNVYITILGAVIASRHLARWGAPEISAYLAAMVAERYAPRDRVGGKRSRRRPQPGSGQWFRSLRWFGDVQSYGPDDRVALDFSVPTLERGLARLRKENLITWTHVTRSPRTKQRLQGRRNFYTNMFADLERPSSKLSPAQFEAELLAADRPE
jgi:hypothetical protein